MSYLLNDPADFADEATAGFVAAHHTLVRRVNGGVARAEATAPGQVAVVIGGGTGHYPAFAGLVGAGLAHAAAMGNVFASPSSQQVYAVAKSVTTEAGVLLTYGNYAGDVLNFDQAEERLRKEGIPCRTVRVTDDIYSAPSEERAKRRGIAGDLAVFRAAAWASEQGMSLDEVAEVAMRANERTRSLGVAFSGCTLPGAKEPLFDVPTGQMAVGMGIHGEPGIEVAPLPRANELASLLVEGLLRETPDDIHPADLARVTVIVNGLGSVKSEELFIIYAAVSELLEQAGFSIVEPEVGEYATSFEMAGVSLTLFWLDDELEAAWSSPALTPAYRKGTVTLSSDQVTVADVRESFEPDAIPEASVASSDAGLLARAIIDAIRDRIDQDADELGRLDAIAGDGDHGIGMQRGTHAAAAAAADAVAADAGLGTVLIRAGDAWADKAGGTSGALWGAALRAAGEVFGDQLRPMPASVAAAVTAARQKIQAYGNAKVGDKTMIDALVPFEEALIARVASGDALGDAWVAAAVDATIAAAATAEMLPRMGRARPHGKKSLGTPDPGAISLARAMSSAGEVLIHINSSKEEQK